MISYKLKTMKMKKESKNKKETKIKLRLDNRTIIYIKSKEALKNWLNKFPKAIVLNH